MQLSRSSSGGSGGSGGGGGGGGQRSTKAGLLSGERVCVVHTHSPAESERARAAQRSQLSPSLKTPPLLNAS